MIPYLLNNREYEMIWKDGATCLVNQHESSPLHQQSNMNFREGHLFIIIDGILELQLWYRVSVSAAVSSTKHPATNTSGLETVVLNCHMTTDGNECLIFVT